MGKDLPDITEGDGEADIEISLIEECGIDYIDYAEDNSILTREIFEAHFQKLLETVQIMNDHVAYLILGVLILRTGSALPEDFRNVLIESADWKADREKYIGRITDSEEFLESRKEILLDFQEIVKNYKPGRVVRLMGGGIGPSILIPKKIMKNLLKDGCSLQKIYDILSREENYNKITIGTLLENFKWHFPINSTIKNQSSDEIFRHSQRFILKETFKKYFGMGVRTSKEMQEKFLSPRNPEGITLDELERSVPDYLEVGSWKEAITKYSYPKRYEMYTYMKEACGITEKFYQKEEMITRKRLEENFDKLIFMVDRWENPDGYLKLGLLILKTGSKSTDNVKSKILEFTTRLINNHDYNEELIRGFQDNIKNHIPGQIIDLILTKKDLELWEKIKSYINKISSLQYLLDNGIVSDISLEELELKVTDFYYDLRHSFIEENRKLSEKIIQLL